MDAGTEEGVGGGPFFKDAPNFDVVDVASPVAVTVISNALRAEIAHHAVPIATEEMDPERIRFFDTADSTRFANWERF